MKEGHEQYNSRLHVFMKPRSMKLGYDFNGKKVKSNKASANPREALEEMVDIVRQQVINEDYDLMTSLFDFVGKKKFDKKFVYDEIHKNGFDIDPVIRFTEVKKKDRITFSDYEELIEILNQKMMFDEYMNKIPFKVFMDEFVVKIENVNTGYDRQEGSIYVNIKRDRSYSPDRNVFIFQFHNFLKMSGFATSPFVFLVDIDLIRWDKIFEESSDDSIVFNLTSSLNDAVKVVCVFSEITAAMTSLEDASIIARAYADYHKHPLKTFMVDDICEHTIQLFYALCIIYRASIEMIEEKERRDELRRLQKENPTIITEDYDDSTEPSTYKKKEYKETSTKDGNKVIDLKSGIKMVMKRESYKRVRTHFRKKCNYQYSVVGHFRHYKNGKTVYVNPYNRNKDKPFRGKEYLV